MGKLIRDKIPDIIRKHGGNPVVTVLGETEYREALLAKLLEETTELRDAPASGIAEEIADVLEVLRALAHANGHEWQDIEKIADAKRAERGGFSGRIYLESSRYGN